MSNVALQVEIRRDTRCAFDGYLNLANSTESSAVSDSRNTHSSCFLSFLKTQTISFPFCRGFATISLYFMLSDCCVMYIDMAWVPCCIALRMLYVRLTRIVCYVAEHAFGSISLSIYKGNAIEFAYGPIWHPTGDIDDKKSQI